MGAERHRQPRTRWSRGRTAGGTHGEPGAPSCSLVRRHYARDLAGVDGCTYVHHDFLDGAALYEQPQVRDHLNLAEPVTLLLGNLLHFVPGEIAYTVVADFVRPLAPGSRLVIASIASDLRPAVMEEAMADYSGRVTTSFARSRTEIERFFDGLRLEEPGVVTPPQWHSNPGDVIPPPQQVCTWAAVGVVVQHPGRTHGPMNARRPGR